MNCDHCDRDINHLALAWIHIEVGGANFCSDVCAEEHLDSLNDDEPERIVCDECGRDIPNDRACWYCENVAQMFGQALKHAVVENVRKQGLITDEEAKQLNR